MSSALAPASAAPVQIQLAGEWLVPSCLGGLWWPVEKTLIVSDLHLEKGSSYARQGQMLPPYDTNATLTAVETLCRQYRPMRVISLGDSFHDRSAELRLSATATQRIQSLTMAHDWIWVEGNHDPAPPRHLGGEASKGLTLGPLSFRHEPTGAHGEIAGHLHPAAKVRGRARSVRRRCFASDGDRLIMPALGAFTGGLNVLEDAFQSLFSDGLMAFVMGADRVFALSDRSLLRDQPRASRWRL
ncbi:MAG: ligase-associated DNA damage response endonuclease PdeM [Hyphomonadaceae bacterium]|nr:ligase-associated DNA damage response endonuclease PdeM [Hyphomonadaceae bacterium]